MPDLKKKLTIPVFPKLRSLVKGKILLFSSVLFLAVFSLGSVTFIYFMGRFLLNNTAHELVKTVELERLKLEASVNGEIAIVLRMAGSPLIKRYFSNPSDPELKKMAFEEFAAYRMAFSANSVFWVNDTDKIFHYDESDHYIVDPYNPDDYWYLMTLYETEIYNFNINYNPELGVTNLWINAPVFDNENNPVGIVGTGINLSDFINAIYRDYSETANLYFFNSVNEITGSKDIALVAEKVKINDELSQYWEEISPLIYRHDFNSYRGSGGSLSIDSGDLKSIQTKSLRGVAVVGEIPALAWYITAIARVKISDSLNTGMTALFIAVMIIMTAVVISIYAAHESRLAKGRAEAAREAVISSIEYAGKIQKNLLPDNSVFREAFSDYSIIWKPRDIVGGDIYWIKNFSEGTLLCVCDCTGHGTPGALLTMLVVSAFETTVTEENYKDTSQIIWELEKQLVSVLNANSNNEGTKSLNINDGCDLVVLCVAKDGSVSSSSGRIHIFVCDGKNVTKIKGQRIDVGEGKLKSKNDIKTVNIPANPDNKFYIASDGLFDQPGSSEPNPFGYNTFMNIILANHSGSQSVISEKVWAAFEEHRGESPRVDDFELISFKCKG